MSVNNNLLHIADKRQKKENGLIQFTRRAQSLLEGFYDLFVLLGAEKFLFLTACQATHFHAQQLLLCVV